jgi:hypothetical protein
VIRQAHAYLAGAVSSVALIAAAVVVFVLLISAQAFRDWPISGLGLAGEGDTAAVAPARPVTSGSASTAGGGASSTASGQGAASGNARHPGAGGHPGGGASVTSAPSAGKPTPDSGVGGGSEPAGAPSSPAGAGGSAPSPSGGNAQGGGQSSVTETVTKAVDNTASQVENAIPGAPVKPSVTEATNGILPRAPGTSGKSRAAEVSNGSGQGKPGAAEAAHGHGKSKAAEETNEDGQGGGAPKSPVGQAVDGTVRAVGDLLHPHH